MKFPKGTARSIVDVAAGAYFTLFVTSDERVHGSGSNSRHRMGLPEEKEYAWPERIPGLASITKVGRQLVDR